MGQSETLGAEFFQPKRLFQTNSRAAESEAERVRSILLMSAIKTIAVVRSLATMNTSSKRIK
jgi:hypothetical protein